ncbi:hypothetical protein BKE38_23925 [Pseudoroseomonas deserti]|uniref:HTH luxR-type domain-containing protein n=1 Tax=Teichococcus deserti TaxID=1817963 RepID=A0A1V2GW36_9PROT|nr:hypothetical protein [Pseudoroseomonas deserti]ONG47334.1 hypothetical protein BKE38_23925 [Pseudoroseomonas deserti]
MRNPSSPPLPDWEALTGALYDACLQPEALARFPEQLRQALGASSAAVLSIHGRSGVPVGPIQGSQLDPVALASYQQHWHRHDPRARFALANPQLRVLRGQDAIADADYAATPYYNDFARHIDAFHVAAARTAPDAQGHIGVLALHRPRQLGAFDAPAMEGLAGLLPHLQRAIQLAERLHAAELKAELGLAALDGLRLPALVLSGQGQMVLANAAAEALARAGGPIRLGCRNGALSAGTPRETQFLLSAIARAALGEPGGALTLLHPGTGERLAALVVPLPRALRAAGAIAPDGMAPGGYALLTLRALDAGEEAGRLEGLLRALFGLTAAEASTAAALAGGASPDAIAAARGVQISTIRTLLRRALDKTAAESLRDLARLLGRLG